MLDVELNNTDEFFMNIAISEAWKFQGLTYPNPAVGAVIVDSDDNVISIGVHKEAGGDHAEVNAIKQAYFKITNDTKIKELKKDKLHQYLKEKHNNIFKDCTIYVTLEPCNHFGKTPPCSHLIRELSFKKVIIGSIDPTKSTGGAKLLKESNTKVKLGVCKKQCDDLLYPFVKWSQDRFIFFKLALYLNGVYEGTNISSKQSRSYMHKLRENIDLLIIGGETVRIDRPTLDTRLASNTNNPDILILSNKKDFDKSIPLFQVPKRKVFIANNIEIIKDYKFIMIEGGANMFKSLKNISDWQLTFINPNIKDGKRIKIDNTIIYSYKNEQNTISWSKNISK